jgi:hypothetical protein
MVLSGQLMAISPLALAKLAKLKKQIILKLISFIE